MPKTEPYAIYQPDLTSPGPREDRVSRPELYFVAYSFDGHVMNRFVACANPVWSVEEILALQAWLQKTSMPFETYHADRLTLISYELVEEGKKLVREPREAA